MTAEELIHAAREVGIELASVEDAHTFGEALEEYGGADPLEVYRVLVSEGEIEGEPDYNVNIAPPAPEPGWDPSQWEYVGSEAWHDRRVNEYADRVESDAGRKLSEPEWARLQDSYAAADGDLERVEFTPLNLDDRDQLDDYLNAVIEGSSAVLTDDTPPPTPDDDLAGYIDARLDGAEPYQHEPTQPNPTE